MGYEVEWRGSIYEVEISDYTVIGPCAVGYWDPPEPAHIEDIEIASVDGDELPFGWSDLDDDTQADLLGELREMVL